MNRARRPSTHNEMREVALLAILAIAFLYFLVGFLNATVHPPGGTGLPVARLLFFGPATLLTAGLFFTYAWRVYFEPQYGRRARHALAGVLLLHLGLNLALLGPFLRK